MSNCYACSRPAIGERDLHYGPGYKLVAVEPACARHRHRLTLAETLRRMPSPRPCHPNCNGWDIFATDDRGPQIHACDECWAGLDDSSRVYDEDVAQLPDAMAALALAKGAL